MDINSSSSSSETLSSSIMMSDDDDDLLELAVANVKRPKNENYFEDTVPLYSDQESFEHFRLSRHLADDIAEKFENSQYFKRQLGEYGKLTALMQVLIFLWFAGHQTAYYRDVADRFNISISSLFNVIRRVAMYLSDISGEVITWPSHEEKILILQHFEEKGFPGVIGVIDGTHIKIDKPQNDPDSYLNRKTYYSIQMQVVCDNNLVIRDIFIGFPGSVHDSRVFRESPLFRTLEDKCEENYLLGDSAYPSLRHLLTPYPDHAQLDDIQQRFYLRLSRNRYIIEHCFGVLKQKFRQLYHIKLRKINDIVHFIRACSVLRNLALTENVENELENAPLIHEIPLPEVEEYHAGNREGFEFRNFIARNVLPP